MRNLFKLFIEMGIEIMPFLWLIFTIIHWFQGNYALPMLCFTIFQFLTVYVLLWSKER